MNVTLRYLRLLASYGLFAIFVIAGFNYKVSVYVLRQAAGQLNILVNTQSIEEFALNKNLSEGEQENLDLIRQIKQYSVDSLGFNKTKSYKRIFDQGDNPVLWVITVCEPYELKSYEWKFPVIGTVSYKGFFRKELAVKEYNHFKAQGYDVELRSVSAWSTLGWLPDPILSSMLKRSKGSVCNLVFHELFHATYYAPNTVSFNENIASFIADKATIQYLANDTLALNEYLENQKTNKIFNDFLFRKADYLKIYYRQIRTRPDRNILKLRFINEVVDSIGTWPVNEQRKKQWINRVSQHKNALFISYDQYDSMQDSLDKVFNKFYEGRLKKMVQDLKQKGSNY